MPTTVFVQEGSAIDYVPTVDTPAGSVVVVEDLLGITRLDIKANELGALHMEGVYEFPKEVGANKDIAYGRQLYWKENTQEAVKGDGGGNNKPLGKCVKAVGENDPTVAVRLG